MKSSNLRKSEAGQLLVYVTIVLMLAGLIIPPLLGFVSGAGRTAQIRQDRMLHVYAADAGMEDAFYRIGSSTAGLPQTPDAPPWVGNISDVNGYYVDVEIYKEAEEGVYRITSTATSDSGVSVTIEAYTSLWDYWSLMGNACSSQGNIVLKPGSKVYGNVTLNGELTGGENIVDGNATYGIPGWPEEDELDELKDFYYDGVEGQPPYGSSQINIQNNVNMGPLYRQGDLDIYSSNSTATLTLMGTFYVTGDLDIGQTGQYFVLDLNGHTIFSASESDEAIRIGGKCTITGSGCIIALGGIKFMPKMESGSDHFLFVMSVSDDIRAQPNGDFYGSFAGDISIQLQPGYTIRWTEPPPDLNFFGGSPLVRIETYTIK